MTTQNILSLLVGISIALFASWKLSLVASSCYLIIIPASYMQQRLVKSTSISRGSIDDAEVIF